MKKTICLILVLISSLALAACSVVKASLVSGTPASGQSLQAKQLALGTIKLDKTQYQVEPTQAAQLLPLWKAARCLGQSDTTAAEEETALIKQIQNTMTADQLKAIQTMEFTAQDLPVFAQDTGLQTASTGTSGNIGSTSGSAVPAAGQAPPADMGGGMAPGGGIPLDGGGPTGSSASAAQVTQSVSSGKGSFMGISATVLDEMIKFLEAKVS